MQRCCRMAEVGGRGVLSPPTGPQGGGPAVVRQTTAAIVGIEPRDWDPLMGRWATHDAGISLQPVPLLCNEPGRRMGGGTLLFAHIVPRVTPAPENSPKITHLLGQLPFDIRRRDTRHLPLNNSQASQARTLNKNERLRCLLHLGPTKQKNM